MAGITTSDTIMDRMRDVLVVYLDGEIDLVDTRNNTVAGVGSDNHFTTPLIPAVDVQVYRDSRTASPIRVVVEEGRRVDNNDFQVDAQAGSPASTPRLDRSVRITVSVRVASTTGAWKQDGARRRCNRVAEAVRVIFGRFWQLEAPGADPVLDALVTEVVFTEDSVPAEVETETWQYWQRDVSYDVRTIESRA